MDHTVILTKIKKLLAMAEHANSNPNEAATAARQAQILMDKYNIEMAEVINTDLRRPDSIIQVDVNINYRKGKVYKQTPRWASLLATAVAQGYDCMARLPRVDTVRFLGYETDAQVAAWIYEYLLRTIYRGTPEGLGIDGARAFRLGAVNTIRARLMERKVTESSGRELMVVKHDAIVAKFGVTKYRKTTVTYSHEGAYRAGQEYGRRVNLGVRPITGTPDTKLKLH